MMTQAEKAKHFKSLHIPGEPLILYNIWDAGGAKVLAEEGASAVATGSWSVAAAQGFEDGENIPLDFVLQIVRRIAVTVNLPLTVDFEGAYASELDAVTANVRQIISTGAVGINFEDQVVKGTGLYSIPDQVSRLRAVRKAAELEGIPLFINARTDLFLKAESSESHITLVEEALARASAYAKAGADGFFVPGLTDRSLIERICKETSLPVNVMMRGGLSSVKTAASLGISRASYGPGPYFTAIEELAARFHAIN